MSGFTASNSRIKVVETVSSVDETVFDTDEDMPHIVATSYVSGQTVDFDNLTETRTFVENVCVGGFDPVWNFTFTPSVWSPKYHYIAPQWFNVQFYPTYSRTYIEGRTEFSRTYTPAQYSRDPTYYEYNPCQYTTPVYQWHVDAEEYASTVNLTALPTDEDGNTIPVDFVIVQATGSRTRSGKDPRFDQALPTTVPTKTFSFQGSVLLESSGKANGDSWMRRIMSVYPSGGNLKLRVQESIAQLARGGRNASFPHIGESRSTYNFDFKVFFGKFKS